MPEYQLIVAEVFVERELASHAVDDTPLSLAAAIWLPELCGLDPHFGSYPLLTERQLREAINRGDLKPERHGRSIVVTKRIIREWRELCRAGTVDLASGSGPAKSARTAAPSASPSGTSRTTGGVRRPAGCFARDVRGLKDAEKAEALAFNATEEAKAHQALAAYITAKHTPSVQKGRGAGEILVIDVLLMWGERVVQKRVEDLRVEDAKAGIVHEKPAIYEGRAGRCMARLLQLGEWWQGKTLADVDGDSCDAYVAWRCGQAWKSARPEETGNEARTVSPQGARRELEDMRAAINWHRGRGYCREIVEVSLPAKGKRKEHHLDRPDAARLLLGMWRKREVMTVRKDSRTRAGEKVPSKKRPHRHLCRFTLLGIYTGTRVGAIATAAFDRIPGRSWLDLETGMFHRLAVGQGATNKRQPPVRIPDRLLAHIRRWKRLGVSKDYVVEFNGAPVEQVNKGFGVALDDAGLRGSPHMLRHTCATWLLQRGVKSWDAANYLGMSEKILLEVYGHWAADYQAGIAGGRKKRSLPPPELHDAFSIHYHRDKDLRIATANRDARLARLGLPHRSLATLAKAA